MDLLETTLDNARKQYANDVSSNAGSTVRSVEDLPRFRDSSVEEESASSSDESKSADEGEESGDIHTQQQTALLEKNQDSQYLFTSSGEQRHAPRSRKQPKASMDPKQLQTLVNKHIESLPCLPLPCDEGTAISFPSNLLSKEVRLAGQLVKNCESAKTLANCLGDGSKLITILCLRSGRFAAAVYKQNKCIEHTTSQRYTVRKGQGKAQSTQDGNRRPKSMGAQLRRAGEQLLKEDVLKTLQRWDDFIEQSAVVMISCPNSMLRNLFEGGILSRNDRRIRRIPLDLGRPTFETVEIAHSAMTSLTLREYQPQPGPLQDETATTDDAGKHAAATKLSTVAEEKPQAPEIPIVPLTPLHIAARDCNLETLREGLQLAITRHMINMQAGEDFMTPLHYAAQGTDAVLAASCVNELLVVGHASPCVIDARSRVPWFLASSDKVREAFRRARAVLGEDFCNWTESKVAEALTEEDIRLRKEREAEKNRQKRARQKQKKAEAKAVDNARAEQQRLEAEKQKHEEDAKRIRDGLQPKTNKATIVCDFCQQAPKGMKRNQMFKRLDYVYCSTDCVQKHKRELMAAAAMNRYGS